MPGKLKSVAGLRQAAQLLLQFSTLLQEFLRLVGGHLLPPPFAPKTTALLTSPPRRDRLVTVNRRAIWHLVWKAQEPLFLAVASAPMSRSLPMRSFREE